MHLQEAVLPSEAEGSAVWRHRNTSHLTAVDSLPPGLPIIAGRIAIMRCAALLLFSLAFVSISTAQGSAAGTPPAAQAPAVTTPAATVPANWPTAQFASSKDPSVSKACELLNQMIRALGGDAYLNIQNSQTEGRTYGFYHGQPSGMGNVYWRFWQWPDKERIELTKQRDVVELFDGDKGYEITYKGTATQDATEMQDYLRRRNHSLEWVVRKWLPSAKTMILYDGTAMVERNLADQVTVMNGDNDSVTISIDSRNRLPVKVAYSWRDPNDREFDDESIIYSNYKLVQGVQTPYSTVRNLNGEMSNQRFITSASYNTNLPPATFETKGITYNPTKRPPSK